MTSDWPVVVVMHGARIALGQALFVLFDLIPPLALYTGWVLWGVAGSI